jgi:dephospho-CoA kinase
MLKIGITGGIGSGKTTVSKIFEILEIPVFYADEVAKSLMESDELLVKNIRESFGNDAYRADKSLNRKYLADIVFKDQVQLTKLNKLVHPAVFRAFDVWVNSKKAPYVLKEAAILFESGSYKLCDKNILVTAPEELKLKRVMRRDNRSRDEIRSRMGKQLTDSEAIKLADFVIVNDEEQLLIPQVLAIHEQLMGSF